MVMERILMLIGAGLILSFSGFAQSDRDAERKEYRDSVTSTGTRTGADVMDNDRSDTTEYAIPERNNKNSEVASPSKAVGTPGATGAGNGAYDTDGKVNGQLDAEKAPESKGQTSPKRKSSKTK
jgi:hypothetical protein